MFQQSVLAGWLGDKAVFYSGKDCSPDIRGG